MTPPDQTRAGSGTRQASSDHPAGHPASDPADPNSRNGGATANGATALGDPRTPPQPAPGRLARALRPVHRVRPADWVAVAVLVAVPALMFGIPALIGYAVLPTDDMDQNYPLRVLVGRQLQSGTWPILNPYIWSGTSLLGGWNAGAAYPFTWLFAVLPPIGAWVLNEVVTYATAGIGLYAFCRNERLRPVAALLAGLSFTFGGAFAAHLGHIGLVAGASWIPVAMLALARLSAPASWRSRARWVVALGLAGGLCVLAGEPRAIDTAVLVLGGYGLWRLLRCTGVRWVFAGSALAGGTLTVLLGAVQWAPGLAAVATSQRAAADYALFARGSLHISWLSLLAMPTLLGGSGSLGLPRYFATYNLPEVASYVGVLPLVAAVALLGRLPLWRRLFRRPDRSDRSDDSEPAERRWPEWLVWHALGLVGAVLAVSANTPLGPILHAVPLFGDQRLQSRNIMITDLALAVLLAYWADRWLARRARARAPLSERVLGWLPVLGVAALAAVGIARGPGLARRLDVVPLRSLAAAGLRPEFTASLVLAVAVIALLLVGPRLGRRVRAAILVTLVSADLAGYLAVAGAPFPLPPTANTVATMPDPPAPFDQVGRDGRFVVYGPLGVRSLRLGGVGITDLNVLASRYTMQGYTAIVDGTYATATGTHQPSGGGHNTLSLDTMTNGTLDQLATKYLLTPSSYLVSGVTGAVGGPGSTAAARQPGSEATRTLRAGQTTTWYFGNVVTVTSVSVPVDADRTGAGALRIGLLRPGGATDWLGDPTPVLGRVPAVTARAGDPAGAGAVDAVGVVVRATGGPAVTVPGPTIQADNGQAYLLHGELQDALAERGWAFTGTLDDYSVFTNPNAAPALSLRALPGRSLAGASVRRTAGDPLLPTSAAVTSPAGAVVLRAVSAIPGWTATWHPAGGASNAGRALPVTRQGLVQAVAVPPGTGVLTWAYRPPGLALGAVLGLAGIAVTVGLLAATWVGVRRGRPGRPRGAR